MFRAKNYWDDVINKIVERATKETAKKSVKKFEYSITLPKRLQTRVRNLVGYEFDEFDQNAFVYASEDLNQPDLESDKEDTDDTEKQRIRRRRIRDHIFNESTCSEVERLERETLKFELKLDLPMQHKLHKAKRHHWSTVYACQRRQHRVKWASKIYNLYEENRAKQTLDDQALQLMDASAERLVEYLSLLSTNLESELSKERVKSLFNIEGDQILLRSICTEPKEVKAIAKTVADKWNIPTMAMELKYENYLRNRLKNVPKKIIKVSFGKTIRGKDIPWVPATARDRIVKSVFPKDLLSGEKIFKGISRLRSTNKLMDFYYTHPNFERPKYLLKYKQRATSEIVDSIWSTLGVMKDIEPPLYEKLKLKY